MNVLIIAGGYSPKDITLNGMFAFDQARALNLLGHQVVFLSIDLRSIRRWRRWGTKHSILDGIEMYSISVPVGRLPWNIFKYIGEKCLLHVYRIILNKIGKPNIVHAHFMIIGAIASVLKRKYNLPYLITEHSSTLLENYLDKRTYSIGNFAYKNADKIISVSSALSKKIKQHFNFDSIVIHNMVDPSSFIFERVKKNNGFAFISVGELIYGKGFDLLIEAFNRANFGKDIYLYIVGGGHLKNKLQKQIDAYKLNNQILLLGPMYRNEIGNLMKASDAFVLPSRKETFGLVYIEAMLAGLPVIATSCGGPEEFVNENNGIIIPVENVEFLKRAMIEMYDNINSYNRKLISKKCALKYSPKVIGNQLCNVYIKVITSKGQRIVK